MSRLEVQRELAREVEYVSNMACGIRKKYSKKLMVKGGNCLLGITRYTNPTTRNNLCVVWTKDWNGHFNEIYSTVLIESIENKKRNWVMATSGSWGLDGKRDNYAIIYTQHALERVKERAGLDFNAFLTEESKTGFRNMATTYEYNGVVSNAMALNDKGLFLFETHDWGIICKTFVSANLLGDNQTDKMAESISGGLEYCEYMSKKIFNEVDDIYRGLNREKRRKLAKITKVG